MKNFYFIISFLFCSPLIFSQLNLDWSTQIDKTGSSGGVDVFDTESDNSGNVFVVGSFQGTVDFNVSAAGGDLTAFGTSEDPFIAKYDASGNFLWVNKISNIYNPSGDQSNDRVLSVAVDAGGNAYILSDMYDGGLMGAIARYTPTGTQSYIMQVEHYVSFTSSTEIITTDNSGNFYITSTFDGTKDLNPGAGVDNHTSGSGSSDKNMYIAKFIASTGAYVWGKSMPGDGYTTPLQIEYDAVDNYLYVGGAYQETVDFDPNGGVVSRTSPVWNEYHAFVARYSASTGAYSFVHVYGDGAGDAYTKDLEVVGTELYITSQHQGTADFDFGGGTFNIVAPVGNSVSCIANYNKNTMALDFAYATPVLAGYYNKLIARAGECITMGQFLTTQDFDPSAGTANLSVGPSGGSFAIYSFTDAGVFQWAEMVTGVGYPGPSINWDKSASGDFYLAGAFGSDVYLDPQNTTSITLTDGAVSGDAFVANYSLCISETNTTSTATICETSTKALTSSGAGSGTWSIVSGGGSISGTTYTPANIAVNTSVTVRYTDGCANATDRTFTVNSSPSTAINSVSTASICEGSTKALTSSGAGGGTWSIVSGGGSISGLTYTAPSVAVNTSVTIRYAFAANGTCPGNSDDVTFTVTNNPGTANNTTSTAAICETTTKVLTATPSGGSWSIVSGGGSISGTTYTAPSVASNTNVTIRYTIAAAGGCPGSTDDVVFTVTNTPATANNTTTTTSICETTTKALTATPAGGSWSVVSGGGTISGTTYTAPSVGSNTNVTVRYTIAASGGCSGSTDDVVFTVTDNPGSPTNTTSTAAICETTTKALTATPGGGSWSIVSGGGSISGTTYTAPSVGANTNVTIRYTVPPSGCPGANTSDVVFTVTNNPGTANNTTTTASICETTTKTLTATPSGGSWSVISGGGSISGTTYTASSVGADINVTVRYTIAASGGCSGSTDDVVFTVTNNPGSPNNTTSTAAICEGNTKTLTATPGGGSWSVVSGGGTISGTTYTSPTVGSNTNVTVRYTVPPSGCPGANTSDVVFTVNDNLGTANNTTATTAICEGATKALTATPSGGSWSITSGGGAISGSTYTSPSVGSNTSVTIRYTIPTNGACVGSTDDVIFTVNPSLSQPSTITGATSVCTSSQTYSVTNVPGVTYTWSYTGGGTPSSTTSSVTFTPTSSGTLSVTASNACGISPARTLAITVASAAPLQPSAISGPTSICSSSPQTYSVTNVAGVTYAWTYSGGGTPTGTINSTTFTPTSSGILSVTATNPCGTSPPETLNIVIGTSVPATPGAITGSTMVCSSSQTYGIVPVTGAATYNWTYTGGGTASSTSNTVTFTPTSSGILTVTATNPCGTSAASTLNISVDNGVPATPSPITGNNTICDNTLQTYSVNNVTGVTYTWSYSGAGSPSSTTNSVSFTPTSSGTLSVIATNNCGSSMQSSINIIVDVLSPVNIGGDQTICAGTNVNLSVPSNATYTYLWSDASTLNTFDANPMLAQTIWVRVTNSSGCIVTDTLNISITGPTSINANDDSITVITDRLTVLNVSTNDSQSGTLTVINDPLFGVANIDNNGNITYKSYIDYIGTDVLTYEICDAFCFLTCDTATVYLKVEHNVFENTDNGNIGSWGVTPNGDGINDVLLIDGLFEYPNNEITIYNRWGDRIYNAKPYNQDWNGTFPKKVVNGTYFFILEIEEKSEPFKGFIHLQK